MTIYADLGNHKKLILVVEDENAISTLMGHQFMKAGYRVTFAHDGFEAIEAVRCYKPDLVTTGVMMPRLDGFAFQDLIRADEAIKDTPIVFISGLRREYGEERALKGGAKAYIVKPFNPTKLLEIINMILCQPDKEIPRELIEVASNLHWVGSE